MIQDLIFIKHHIHRARLILDLIFLLSFFVILNENKKKSRISSMDMMFNEDSILYNSTLKKKYIDTIYIVSKSALYEEIAEESIFMV